MITPSIHDQIESLKNESKRRIFWRWWLIISAIAYMAFRIPELFIVDPDPQWLEFVRGMTGALVVVGIVYWIESRISVLERAVALLAQKGKGS